MAAELAEDDCFKSRCEALAFREFDIATRRRKLPFRQHFLQSKAQKGEAYPADSQYRTDNSCQ
jgi:hypothetical protein